MKISGIAFPIFAIAAQTNIRANGAYTSPPSCSFEGKSTDIPSHDCSYNPQLVDTSTKNQLKIKMSVDFGTSPSCESGYAYAHADGDICFSINPRTLPVDTYLGLGKYNEQDGDETGEFGVRVLSVTNTDSYWEVYSWNEYGNMPLNNFTYNLSNPVVLCFQKEQDAYVLSTNRTGTQGVEAEIEGSYDYAFGLYNTGDLVSAVNSTQVIGIYGGDKDCADSQKPSYLFWIITASVLGSLCLLSSIAASKNKIHKEIQRCGAFFMGGASQEIPSAEPNDQL